MSTEETQERKVYIKRLEQETARLSLENQRLLKFSVQKGTFLFAAGLAIGIITGRVLLT